MKNSNVLKFLGILITLLVSVSASYAADTSDINSNDSSNQVLTDTGLSDDSGLSDSNTDDVGNDLGTDDNNNDTFNDSTDPTIYYAMEGNGTSGPISGNGNLVVATPTTTVTTMEDPQKDKIPM